MPLTYKEKQRKSLAAFMEIGEWYVKHQRPISMRDMRAIGTKHFGTGDEYTEFLEYLATPEGTKELRRELREIMRTHGISIPPEEEWLPLTELHSTTGKKYVRFKSGPHIGSIVSVESWEREREGHLQRGEVPPEVEYLSEKGEPTEKLLPALKPFDPYKFADYVLRNNVFSDTDTFVYSGLSGTNPHGVKDHIWAEALAGMRGEFIKTGDLYVVHTPGVERPPTMRAAPTRQEPSGELSLETIERLAKVEGDPLRKFCCRQCGECAPAELLEEGRFPDRIAWLRHHYKEKHPSMWGKVSAATIPEGIPRRLSLEQVSGLETRFPIEKLWADEKAYLDKLTTEIEREGLTEPITIRVRDDGSLIVWDGIHRLAVAQKLGIEDIPVEFIGTISAFPKGLLAPEVALPQAEPVTPEVTYNALQQLSSKYDIHLTGSYTLGKAKPTGDIDVIVSVSDEIFTEPMSTTMKEIEEDIWKQVPQADVFFSKADKSEVIVIPAFMRGGEVNAKQIWKGAKRISEIAIPKAEPGMLAVIPTEPTGKCYEDAWHFLFKEHEGELIHGSVQTIGKRINHAWVELPTGFVWEPESGVFMKKASFYERAQPQVEAKYTVEEAAVMAVRTKNLGPWTEQERKQYLKEKSPAVILTEPSPPSPKEELEFVCDSPEFLAYTIEDIGYREKLDTAFETAIARAKGG